MAEVWLRPNRRALAIGLIPAAGLSVVGVLTAWGAAWPAVQAVGWCLAAGGLLLAAGLMRQFRRPRIAFEDGNILFYLRSQGAIAVPAGVVEAFFLGQGPAMLPQLAVAPAESRNLVARISQKAPQWAEADVKSALGCWHEGYVTIRGTWCEPLDGEVVRRLNRRLREIREASAEDRS